jgi:Cys-tRNA(Pro)/Cys-tRNA(Cys) deacylase
MPKTNAIRLLASAGLEFIVHEYEMDGHSDALYSAGKLGAPPEQVFKTLVTVSPTGEHLVFVIPGAGELDLKKAAKASGQKSIVMIHQKELLPLTGYIHGGCSPVGMKKAFPTYIDETAILFDTIYVSGGAIGCTLQMNPERLADFVHATFVDLCK